MADRPHTKPTDAEIAILQFLWQNGPSTVRQVQDTLHGQRGTGYTTTLKLMQIMFEKQLLKRDESQRSYVYSPAISQTRTQDDLLHRLVDQVFAGSAHQLVLRALSSGAATAEELAELRQMLDRLEGEQS